VRLDRILGNLGHGSRPEVQRLVRSGRVAIDGAVVRDPARHAEPGAVTLDGSPLDHPSGVLAALHKPVGYVCSRAGEEGPTIYELLPQAWDRRSPRPEAVGRLDRDTSGLLLVTDDHDLLHRLTSPRHHVAKTYVAGLARPVTEELLATFASGELVLRGEDAPCRPVQVTVVDDRTTELVLTEGRYHQVRRMFAACGNHVESLHRTAVGGCRLGDLGEGAWRDVTTDEVGSAG